MRLQVGLEKMQRRGKPGAERKEGGDLQGWGDALGFRERPDTGASHVLEPCWLLASFMRMVLIWEHQDLCGPAFPPFFIEVY